MRAPRSNFERAKAFEQPKAYTEGAPNRVHLKILMTFTGANVPCAESACFRAAYEAHDETRKQRLQENYGQLSTNHVCFCGLDSGSLKFETVRTNKQHISF